MESINITNLRINNLLIYQYDAKISDLMEDLQTAIYKINELVDENNDLQQRIGSLEK